MADNTGKFDGLGKLYEKYRPGYPDELYTYLHDQLGLIPSSRVVEVGSGTGIFSRFLLNHDIKTVYGVEPNADMRSQAEKNFAGDSGFVSVDGSAENTGLDAESTDYIFAVQAFHWFDHAAFKTECRRILKPGGLVVLIWNSQNNDKGVNDAIREACYKHCPNFTGFSGEGLLSSPDAVSKFFDGKFESREFANHRQMDKDGFIGRNLSRSYAPREGDAGHQPYIEELERVFEKFQVNGTVTIENKTRCYSGRL